MDLSEVAQVLGAEVLYGSPKLLRTQVKTAAASDLMSDILARTEVPDILLTRLSNAQAIQTASIFGIRAVVIVRGRPVKETVVAVAKEESVVLMRTPSSLFESCGKLYAKGMHSTGGHEE